MDPPGFEPGASALQGRRSPRLSYGPILSWFDRFDLVSDCHHKMFKRSKIGIFGATNTKVFDCFFCKEVIQPQVPLRLPCYDFALLKEPRFDPNLRLRPHPNPFWVA